jgi:hypothetical protein
MLINSLSWFKFAIHSGPSAPPIFNSFGDMVAAFRLLGPNQNLCLSLLFLGIFTHHHLKWAVNGPILISQPT